METWVKTDKSDKKIDEEARQVGMAKTRRKYMKVGTEIQKYLKTDT